MFGWKYGKGKNLGGLAEFHALNNLIWRGNFIIISTNLQGDRVKYKKLVWGLQKGAANVEWIEKRLKWKIRTHATYSDANDPACTWRLRWRYRPAIINIKNADIPKHEKKAIPVVVGANKRRWNTPVNDAIVGILHVHFLHEECRNFGSTSNCNPFYLVEKGLKRT